MLKIKFKKKLKTQEDEFNKKRWDKKDIRQIKFGKVKRSHKHLMN